MRKIILLLGIALSFSVRAQFMVTDSLDLGEDSTTHGYTKYGNISVGTYSCGTNKSIRVGTGTGADSLVFNLAVTPNVDSVKIEIVMPWHGGVQRPKIWVENMRNDTVPYLGVGNCIPVFIKMGGLASKTNDGLIKVKLMDTLNSFNMDGQFTYIKVLSKIIGASVNEKQKTESYFEIYPNPSSGYFRIKGDIESSAIRVYDILGVLVYIQETSNVKIIDISSLPAGIYFVKIGNANRRIIKQ